jgi:hypothetical protein
VGEGLVAAASALRSSLLLFGRPERKSLSLLLERAAVSHLGFRTCGGQNQSSICNGTLIVGVYSLWLSGPEHVCIFGMKPCFFLISSTRTRLSAN